MANRLDIPPQLNHLIEKRSGENRRESDDQLPNESKSAATESETGSGSDRRSGEDRRKSAAAPGEGRPSSEASVEG